MHIDKLSCSVSNDIKEFIQENGAGDANVHDLDLRQALDMYLKWNGIHGYTAQILMIVEAFAAHSVLTRNTK